MKNISAGCEKQWNRSDANGPRDHWVHQVCAPMMGGAPEPQHNLMSHLILGEKGANGLGAEKGLEAPLYCRKGISVSVDKRIRRYQWEYSRSVLYISYHMGLQPAVRWEVHAHSPLTQHPLSAPWAPPECPTHPLTLRNYRSLIWWTSKTWLGWHSLNPPKTIKRPFWLNLIPSLPSRSLAWQPSLILQTLWKVHFCNTLVLTTIILMFLPCDTFLGHCPCPCH